MKTCGNPNCSNEISEKRKYCSSECQRLIFANSQKGKRWTDEKKALLSEKLKITNNSPEVKNKRKKTCLERYGGIAPASSKEVQEKIKQTCLKRYDVENVMQFADCKNKAKQSMIDTYGGFTFQSNELKEKVKTTNMERYGVETPASSSAVKNQIKQTCLERYGFQNVMMSPEIQEKSRQTCLERYGFQNVMMSPEIQAKIKLNNIEHHGTTGSTNRHLKVIWGQLNSEDWWNEFNTMSEVRITLQNYLSSSGIEKYTHKFRADLIGTCKISIPHQRIINLLKDHHIDHEVNTRNIITPKELDIFIPSKKLAIEINGIYWHSEVAGGKDKNYHLTKTLECEKNDIKLLQFWDIEIEQKWDIVASMILNACGLNEQRIGARKCQIVTVDSKNAVQFFNQNHIQGSCPASVYLGLIHDHELISCMSFIKSRFKKDVEWELARFATRLNTSVPGGFSRLLNLFSYPCVSYSDRRYSQGLVYEKNGFVIEHINLPAYHYTKEFNILENRIKYQKHKLSKLLESFDPSLTEWQNMVNHGYDRVWDCGSKTWKYK